MDMIEHLHRLFVYDDWANRQVLASLQQAETAPARSLKLMGHILSAERLWLERLQQQRQTFPSGPTLPCRSAKPKLLNCPAFGRITWMPPAKPAFPARSATKTAKARTGPTGRMTFCCM